MLSEEAYYEMMDDLYGDQECGEYRAMREDAEREARMEAAHLEAEEAERRAAFEAQQADPMRAVCDDDHTGLYPTMCGFVSDDCPF